MTTTQIDLQKFCERDETPRYDINQPWVEGGWRYATDGRVLVRVPAPDEPDSPRPVNNKKRPRAFEILQPAVDGDWEPWPAIDRCSTCGSDRRMMPCDNCHGNGMCICDDCECEHKCGQCQGTGEEECMTCMGSHGVDHMFGQSKLAHRYAYMISKLPNAVYLPTEDKDAALIRFKFDGGEGAVCPLKQD